MTLAAEQDIEPIVSTFLEALKNSEEHATPYRHWFVKNLFPEKTVDEIEALTFPVPDLDGVSGKRELHNELRHYFDQPNIHRVPVIRNISSALQSSPFIHGLEAFFDINLTSTYLRIEYAQDNDGFWLQPHTDLGVKKLTVLIYMSGDEGHDTLGTDIFNADKSWATRTPFEVNSALAFVPGDDTYHGFQKRTINGVRKSLILNYVTDAWRDREQLAFPERPVGAS